MRGETMSTNEVFDAEIVEASAAAIQVTTSAPLVTAEMRMGVEMARMFPRDLRDFQNSLMTAVSTDKDTAAMCFYTKPQAGGSVLGPSVRLAELAVASYGNLATGSRPGRVDRQEKECTGIGYAMDLERNIYVQTEVTRPIRKRDGGIYQDAMISTTLMAASAIARRNAIFQVIPRVYVDRAYHKARSIVAGEEIPMEKRREDCMAALEKLGADKRTVLESIGVKSLEMLTLDHILDLRGRYVAIRDGEILVDDAFPPLVVPQSEDVAGLDG
jgi:hypothetical protein